MYSRVLASSADPAGRGPNSTCLRTCSKARAPSIASRGEAAVLVGEAAGGATVFPVLEVGLESLPGQARKRSGSVSVRRRPKAVRAFFTRDVIGLLLDKGFICYRQKVAQSSFSEKSV